MSPRSWDWASRGGVCFLDIHWCHEKMPGLGCWRMRDTWGRAVFLIALILGGSPRSAELPQYTTLTVCCWGCTGLERYNQEGVVGILCGLLFHCVSPFHSHRTVSLLDSCPLNACSILQPALWNSKCTHVFPNATWAISWVPLIYEIFPANFQNFSC